MPKTEYVAEDDVIMPKSAHSTANMKIFDEIMRPLVNGQEEVIKLTPEGNETPRGLRLSAHRAGTRQGIKVITWEAPDKIVYAKIKPEVDSDAIG